MSLTIPEIIEDLKSSIRSLKVELKQTQEQMNKQSVWVENLKDKILTAEKTLKELEKIGENLGSLLRDGSVLENIQFKSNGKGWV
jgi:hypothetical protein